MGAFELQGRIEYFQQRVYGPQSLSYWLWPFQKRFSQPCYRICSVIWPKQHRLDLLKSLLFLSTLLGWSLQTVLPLSIFVRAVISGENVLSLNLGS